MTTRLLRGLLALQCLFGLGVAAALWHRPGWQPYEAMLAGVAAPLAWHALLLAMSSATALLARSPVPPEQRLGFLPWLKGWIRNFLDSIRTFDLRMPLMAAAPLASAPDPGAGRHLPVLLIHGFACNHAAWRPMARWLAARGHVVGSVDLDPTFADIDDYAPRIEAEVEALLARTGLEQVALVCHSMGGLAARAWMRRYSDLRVARIVTFGTPHRGIRFNGLGFATNLRQLGLDSDWLRALARTEPVERRRLFTIVLSHHDSISVPQAIQVLPDAEVIEVEGVGHVSLICLPELWERVAPRLLY